MQHSRLRNRIKRLVDMHFKLFKINPDRLNIDQLAGKCRRIKIFFLINKNFLFRFISIAPTAKLPKVHPANPVVFFDIEIDDEKRGTLIMELFRHALPKTSQNFLSLSLGDRGFGYKYSYLHRIIPGFMAQGGDFEKSDGTGGYSIYGPTFNDEGFPFRHDRAGLLSMANSGPNTNGSQFFITFGPAPHLDGKHTVFGQVLQGYHLLDDFRLSGSESGEPVRAVKIANCGQLQ